VSEGDRDSARQPDPAVAGEERPGTAVAPTAASHAENLVGRELDGRYRVTTLLGKGGMGAVYVARHLALHKEVALKVVRAELAGNGEVATRFAREAMATAQFEHPHVASAIDYGTLPEGGAYFVMQLVRGRSLRHLITGGRRLAWRRACMLMAQVADALSAARGAGIIHRDLKPDNILVEPREDGSELAKVLDFGIAHVAPRDAPAPEGAQADRHLTKVGTVMGTPGYMAPEQAVGDSVDHRADLYALGVLLWESITGEELWDAPDLTSTVTRQMTEPVPKLRDRLDDPTLPAELDELVQRLTARSPDDRPERAGEVRDVLRRLALQERTSAPLAALGPRLRQSVVPRITRIVERYRTLPGARRAQLLGGAGASIALAMVLALSGGDDESQSSRLSEIVIAAEEAVKPAVRAAREAVAPEPAIPEAAAQDVETMLEGDRLRVRRPAARRLLDFEPPEALPEYILTIARFETARTCRTRREIISSMEDAPHEAYLRPLRRMAGAPKRGCGFLSLSDCYGCVRRPLARAIETLEQAFPEAAQPEAGKPTAKAPGQAR
jgi:serine/threonine-protein kinase